MMPIASMIQWISSIVHRLYDRSTHPTRFIESARIDSRFGPSTMITLSIRGRSLREFGSARAGALFRTKGFRLTRGSDNLVTGHLGRQAVGAADSGAEHFVGTFAHARGSNREKQQGTAWRCGRSSPQATVTAGSSAASQESPYGRSPRGAFISNPRAQGLAVKSAGQSRLSYFAGVPSSC